MKTKKVYIYSQPTETPLEVVWVWAVSGNPMGQETYDKIRKIIKKYPEWFPWETKYNSIPQEVHDAYKGEVYPEKEVKKDVTPKVIVYTGERVMLKDMVDTIQEYFNRQYQRKMDKRVEKDRLRKIWNKHYSKYNLSFNG